MISASTAGDTQGQGGALLPRIDQVLAAMAGMSPGPWAYRSREHDDWGAVRGPDGWIVALAREGGTSDDRDAQQHRDAGTDPYEGNARAITALPDAHELLTDLRPLLATAAQERAVTQAQLFILTTWNSRDQFDGLAVWHTRMTVTAWPTADQALRDLIARYLDLEVRHLNSLTRTHADMQDFAALLNAAHAARDELRAALGEPA